MRRAVPEDAPTVTALLEKSYATLMADAYDADVLQDILPRITRAQPTLLASGRFFVADAEPLAGCGGWSLERPGSNDTVDGVAHVRHFGVHPEWTRRGVGSAIFARCLDDAGSAGVERLMCYAFINGEAFYSALGFRRIGPIEVDLPDGLTLPSILMQLDL